MIRTEGEVIRDEHDRSVLTTGHGGSAYLFPRSVVVGAIDGAVAAEAQSHLAASTLGARGGRWVSEASAVLSYYAAIEELFVDHTAFLHAAIADQPDQHSVDVIETLTVVREPVAHP